MCYNCRPTLSGPKGIPTFVQVLCWSRRVIAGNSFYVTGFSVGIGAAVVASGDAVTVARAEASLFPSFH